MGAIQKICCACGTDVAGKKRVKDGQGNYYCQGCYEAKLEATRAGAVVAAQVATASMGSVGEAAAEDGIIDLAEDLQPKEAAQEEMFGCADCKQLVPKRQVRNDDGEFVCVPCFTRRRNAARKQVKVAMPKSRREEEEEERGGAMPFAHTMIGGLLISAGILAGSWALFTALGIAMPLKSEEAGVLYSILFATVETIFNVFKAGALIGSMFMASKIVGGCDFGYLGSALWKSILIVVVFSMMTFFMDRSETLMMLGFAFKGILFLLSFVVVFKLDLFEALVLAVVNFFVFWGLTIAMAVMLVVVVGAVIHHPQYDDEDEGPPAAVGQPNPGVHAPAPLPGK